MNIIEIAGILPAIVFPAATLIQLVYLLKNKTSEGVSAGTWFAFALGNVSLYIYTEKYDAIQSILGQLVSAILQFYIVFLIFKYRKNTAKQN
jgi:lipid-A-disaccharide synthase-like uncharacterized protein